VEELSGKEGAIRTNHGKRHKAEAERKNARAVVRE
jgi:hypothetical protein